MSEGNKCPQCGRPLESSAVAGLCPACLLQQGAAESATGGSRPFNPPTVAELTAKFPQLEILELIGKGGMGAVYKARQKELDRIVALKILPPGIGDDPAFAERFAREAKALAKLNYPGIVTIYDFGRADGLFYFLMEFVDGVTLRQLLNAGRVSPREALAIVPQICDALQFAHDQGIVHRDIKPENILLDRRGRVKVADFGLAKLVEGNAPLTPSLSPSDGERVAKPGEGSPVLTESGKVMGTPNYMAPEQKEHPDTVDHRADIYALGVVFYQMLTGELPGKKIEPPSRKVQIDMRLDEVVLRALEKNPELRYQQVSEVKSCVETIVSSPDSSRRRGDESQTDKPESQSLLTSAPTSQEPRFSRMAIAGAIWSGMGFLVCISAAVFELKSSFTDRLLTLFVLTAPFGTTILGWIAVSQIRRSAEKLHGLWLAVFDGLFFPLLAVDALFGSFWIFILKAIDSYHQMTLVWTLLVFATIAGVDLLIVRWVWRVVNKPVGAPVPPMIQKPDRFWRWFAVAVFAMISIPILISIVGLLAAVAIPNFIKGREMAQANARHVAAQMATSQPAAQNLSFGPVIERVIQARETGTNLFLDLDTGKLLTPPLDVTETLGGDDRNWEGLDIPEDSRPFRYIQWLRENGADLMFSGADKLIGFDGMFPFAHGNNSTNWENWNDLTPAQVQIDVAVIEWGRKASEAARLHQPSPEAPRTGGIIHSAMQMDSSSPGGPLVNLLTLKQSALWFFKTHDGAEGILQIIGFTDNPRGVKIRYKLVQKPAAEITPVEDDVAQLKREIEANELEIAKKKFQAEVLSQAGKELSASNIVALMKLAYATIYTYRDTGWTVHQYGDDAWTNKFSEMLDRRKFYRIEVVTAQHPFSQTNRWWSDGDTEFWQESGSIIFKNSNPASEAGNLSLVNQDSVMPALFFNLNWGNILATMSYSSPAELVRKKDETIGGVYCYVLERTDAGLTVWVGKQDFLIRRYRQSISKTAAAEAMKHSPKPNTNSLPAQDITNIETHENVIVNENIKREDFIPPLDDGK